MTLPRHEHQAEQAPRTRVAFIVRDSPSGPGFRRRLIAKAAFAHRDIERAIRVRRRKDAHTVQALQRGAKVVFRPAHDAEGEECVDEVGGDGQRLRMQARGFFEVAEHEIAPTGVDQQLDVRSAGRFRPVKLRERFGVPVPRHKRDAAHMGQPRIFREAFECRVGRRQRAGELTICDTSSYPRDAFARICR